MKTAKIAPRIARSFRTLVLTGENKQSNQSSSRPRQWWCLCPHALWLLNAQLLPCFARPKIPSNVSSGRFSAAVYPFHIRSRPETFYCYFVCHLTTCSINSASIARKIFPENWKAALALPLTPHPPRYPSSRRQYFPPSMASLISWLTSSPN